MFCLLPFRSSGCLSWIDFSDARVVGIEPTTCGFGDRCSTNWATPVTPPYCVKTYAQVGFGLKLPFAHALAGFRWADDRDWTGDLVLTKDVLCRLSYMGIKKRETGFEPATLSLEGWRSTAELFPQIWRGKDSNLRRLTPTGLQPVPFGHSGTPPNLIL